MSHLDYMLYNCINSNFLCVCSIKKEGIYKGLLYKEGIQSSAISIHDKSFKTLVKS